MPGLEGGMPTPRQLGRGLGSCRGRSADGRTIVPLKKALEGPEKEIIAATLASVNWNRQKAAKLLDINRTTLFNKMRKYGLLEIKRGGKRKVD